MPPHDEIYGFNEKEKEDDINWGNTKLKECHIVDYFDPEDFEDDDEE